MINSERRQASLATRQELQTEHELKQTEDRLSKIKRSPVLPPTGVESALIFAQEIRNEINGNSGRDVFTLITGPVNSGKTYMRRELEEYLRLSSTSSREQTTTDIETEKVDWINVENWVAALLHDAKIERLEALNTAADLSERGVVISKQPEPIRLACQPNYSAEYIQIRDEICKYFKEDPNEESRTVIDYFLLGEIPDRFLADMSDEERRILDGVTYIARSHSYQQEEIAMYLPNRKLNPDRPDSLFFLVATKVAFPYFMKKKYDAIKRVGKRAHVIVEIPGGTAYGDFEPRVYGDEMIERALLLGDGVFSGIDPDSYSTFVAKIYGGIGGFVVNGSYRDSIQHLPLDEKGLIIANSLARSFGRSPLRDVHDIKRAQLGGSLAMAIKSLSAEKELVQHYANLISETDPVLASQLGGNMLDKVLDIQIERFQHHPLEMEYRNAGHLAPLIDPENIILPHKKRPAQQNERFLKALYLMASVRMAGTIIGWNQSRKIANEFQNKKRQSPNLVEFHGYNSANLSPNNMNTELIQTIKERMTLAMDESSDQALFEQSN